MGQTEVTSLMKGITHPTLELFKKDKYIGKGGFGHVWKVLYLKADYYLAMKQLSKNELYKNKFISNIFGERDILNYIYNIHIVNLYLTFQDENYLYLIMDYLEGGDLRKHMKQKKFNIQEIKFVAACIIIGFEYIHKKGVIHRDIKPENLIFDDKGYLRISDFGIAIRNDLISEEEKNQDKSGTPGYMAPERIIISKNTTYSYYSDYFSLGVILYELTMLKKPFRRNTDKIGKIKYTSFDEIIQDLFNGEPININPLTVRNHRNDNLDNNELTNLCDLINKLLVYDQKKRLGYDSINNIKKHPFFGERFEWKKIYHRSYKSPFNTYEYYFSKRLNERKDSVNDDLNEILNEKKKINNLSDEEKKILQEKFQNFTMIHKITKEDFNYFYLKSNNNVSISSNRNDSDKIKINKYSNSKKTMTKKTLTAFTKKNIEYFSQAKNDSHKISKFKIQPNKLFKDNKDNYNQNTPNILKIKVSPEQIKMPVGLIKDNLINKYLNKTNLDYYKIDNIKNNFISKMNDCLPLIHSSKANSNSVLKPTSAIFQKKKKSCSIDNNKNKINFYFNKNIFKNNCTDLKNQKENDSKRKDLYYNTDSNQKLISLANTSRKKFEQYRLLKDNAAKIIKAQIVEIKNKNKNINKAIKDVIIHG